MGEFIKVNNVLSFARKLAAAALWAPPQGSAAAAASVCAKTLLRDSSVTGPRAPAALTALSIR